MSRPWNRQLFLKQGTKNTNHKREKRVNWITLKLRTSGHEKTLLREEKGKPQLEKLLALHISDKEFIPRI